MTELPLRPVVRAGSPAGTSAGLGLLFGGATTIGIAYAAAIVSGSAPVWAPWCLAFGSATTAVGLFVIGAATRGILSGAVAAVLTALFVVLIASFGAALAIAPDEAGGGRLLLGLPARLAIVFYGVGVVPLVALPVVFGLTFGRTRDAGGEGS